MRCLPVYALLLLAALAAASSEDVSSSAPSSTASSPTKTDADLSVPVAGDGEDELTERQTLSRDATVLCRTSARGKNDPNVRGYAYTSNRCVALCRNGYGIPWRQTFSAQTTCASGMVCVNRECMQAGTSRDLQTCTTIFNQSRRKARQVANFRVEAGVISGCRLRCFNPTSGEALRVNRDDGERCQNRLYEGVCRGGVCRSPNEGIAAIGSVIPIPYQEANAFANPEDQGIEVEETGFGDEFTPERFDTDPFSVGVAEKPLHPLPHFVAAPAPAVQATNGSTATPQ
ncbi:uncharacterized protein LOC144139828 [Haemaphysalis longicornis]